MDPTPVPSQHPPSGRVTDVTRDSSVKVTRPTATSTTGVTRQHLSESVTALTVPRGSVLCSLGPSCASHPTGLELDRSANRGSTLAAMEGKANLGNPGTITYLFELGTYEFEGCEDGISVAGDGDDPLRARAIADVDLRARLKDNKQT